MLVRGGCEALPSGEQQGEERNAAVHEVERRYLTAFAEDLHWPVEEKAHASETLEPVQEIIITFVLKEDVALNTPAEPVWRGT